MVGERIEAARRAGHDLSEIAILVRTGAQTRSFEERLIVLSAALGIVGMVFLLSLESTGGSVLVPNNLWGTIWAVAPTLIATIVVAWPKLPQRSRGADNSSAVTP